MKVNGTKVNEIEHSGLRLGLCCKFQEQPIHFCTTTAKAASKLTKKERMTKLADLCHRNAQTLMTALEFCQQNGIGGFRINSQILPLKTHPQVGYDLIALPNGKSIISEFCKCKRFARMHDIRLSLHPDQFILLSSEDEGITARSVAELNYHAEFASWVGVDVINIHGGGAYGDKPSALARVEKRIRKLRKNLRSRLTLENDDRVYTPQDLLPICESTGIPLVYDVHHHRCLPDELMIEEATQRALRTWDREPLFHISSSREGWESKTPQYHHDYIEVNDIPNCWRNLELTVEVEAKAKELAVQKLRNELAGKGWQLRK